MTKTLNTVTCWCDRGGSCEWHLVYPDRAPGDWPDGAAPEGRETS